MLYPSWRTVCFNRSSNSINVNLHTKIIFWRGKNTFFGFRSRAENLWSFQKALDCNSVTVNIYSNLFVVFANLVQQFRSKQGYFSSRTTHFVDKKFLAYCVQKTHSRSLTGEQNRILLGKRFLSSTDFTTTIASACIRLFPILLFYRIHLKGVTGTAGKISSISQPGNGFSTKDADNDKCICKCSQMLTGGKSSIFCSLPIFRLFLFLLALNRAIKVDFAMVSGQNHEKSEMLQFDSFHMLQFDSFHIFPFWCSLLNK